MKCCFCGNNSSNVVETRRTDDGQIVRRRRECKSCEKRFTTYEAMKPYSLEVIKSDGSVEKFSRDKLVKGVSKACEKRPVDKKKIENVVDSIEATITEDNRDKISTEIIGEMVMERLKELDEVAYMRFASVYRSFEDINSFKKELEHLNSEN